MNRNESDHSSHIDTEGSLSRRTSGRSMNSTRDTATDICPMIGPPFRVDLPTR